jgi:hypothetical protein
MSVVVVDMTTGPTLVAPEGAAIVIVSVVLAGIAASSAAVIFFTPAVFLTWTRYVEATLAVVGWFPATAVLIIMGAGGAATVRAVCPAACLLPTDRRPRTRSRMLRNFRSGAM